MDAERHGEEAVARRTDAEVEVRGKQRSTWLVVLGAVLLLWGGYNVTTYESDAGLLVGLLGVGLIVAGIVIRPRT